jgi:cell shape-determining protein MreC|tara:strand:- start:83 stop:916 length:834 start_codon:yes stop_codon:yes gene_type:complete
MSRVSTTSGSKALYFFCIVLSAFLLYVDINYKSFETAKNLYKSFTISSAYLLKRVTVDPFIYIFEISKEKSRLMEENKKLKLELEKSHISNFIISRDSKFFIDDLAIEKFLDLNNINKPFHLAKINSFDIEKYLCCSQHRVFIEIFNNQDIDFIGSTAINNQGIIGQIIYDKYIAEVLLLTDVNHVIPIISDNHFCNARGSGRPGIITCTYSKLIWPNPVEIGQEFFSSGMGGVYPSNILIGIVSNINVMDDTNIEFDLNLVADPLQSIYIAVLEGL